ncbi:MAG: heterodisulfide reductase-related iron-sulfur binding cluster [Bacteroidota bacterium]|nr:heterodisulfide reductase-related iron-sulfur binding cluster [Bacteroidota bacterium]
MITLKNFIFLLVLLAAFGFFTFSVRRTILLLKVGKPENRFDQWDKRIGNVLSVAFGQSKIFRDPVAGPIHAGIFWGFLILLFSVFESIVEGLIPGFRLSFLGPIYHFFAIGGDVMGTAVAVAVLLALYRRFISGPSRLRNIEAKSRKDAALILTWIGGIMLSMFAMNATRIALGDNVDFAPAWRPVSTALSAFFHGGSITRTVHETAWWIHIILVLGFLNALPYSKHFHVLTSIPNTFFSNRGIRPEGNGALKPLDLEDETIERFGAADIEDLTWKQLFDAFTCTECGRCTSSCPANLTGKQLSPKKVIMETRVRLEEKGPLLIAGETSSPVLEKRLVPDFINPEEIWACTTCRACVQECPVMIEHVDEIVEMRRNLVLTEGSFPDELQVLYKNLENNFAPWQFSPADRGKWAEELGIPTLKDLGSADEIDFLFWVGCAGSYDARAVKVSRAFAQVLRRAGIRFAILGSEEKCTGDAARRTGNEYLAQMLARENVETLERYGVTRIVTACPHCFHSLKNEYPQFGGRYEVIHHTTLLRELVEQGILPLVEPVCGKTIFHDSCYLGRYNQIYDAPRIALAETPGVTLDEFPRHGDRAFCCGAGGGRLFLEETVGKRINVERTEEALSVGAETIACACPFCMTMLTDGVVEKGAGDRVQVLDIAEIIFSALRKT